MRTDEEIVQWKMESTIGTFYLVAGEKGLRGLLWKRQRYPFAKSLSLKSKAVGHLAKAVRQLEEYFQGRRQKFDLVLDFSGTEFQQSVWRQLSLIPYGHTFSYKQIAGRLESRAHRAVGTANGKNPISIIIPCHRVIASDGTLGGYAGGLAIKRRLLALEQGKGLKDARAL